MDGDLVVRISYGDHLYGCLRVLHTDFWYAGGYCRWSRGHLTVRECMELIERRIW